MNIFENEIKTYFKSYERNATVWLEEWKFRYNELDSKYKEMIPNYENKFQDLQNRIRYNQQFFDEVLENLNRNSDHQLFIKELNIQYDSNMASITSTAISPTLSRINNYLFHNINNNNNNNNSQAVLPMLMSPDNTENDTSEMCLSSMYSSSSEDENSSGGGSSTSISYIKLSSNQIVDKFKNLMYHLVRDWSSEGEAERLQCYTPIINELNEIYKNTIDKKSIKVLCPGSGLGRLAYEISSLGYHTDLNEETLFLIFPLYKIFKLESSCQKIEIYPFIHQTKNIEKLEDQLRPIYIPDLIPDRNITKKDGGRLFIAPGDFFDYYKNDIGMFKLFIIKYYKYFY
ncbi:hypothetical protein DLAC_03573 [Tieghemostelium lacteum]|uniref:Uncharacterized protein n=1 Tax=Tieghemostelium lacteum TaxID=361077 RepID=A0A152A1M0_TIELA|nr:hypothetical protein DLAC_03573 [Tieghemostelium lacteum]|eukprot:KYQ99984.1 hypothetical protein DLAC_03573 [Tieghemostelium lacteum]